MYIKVSKYAFLLSPLFAATLAYAGQQPQVVISTVQDQEAVTAYWTPERMRDATPMDLPMVDSSTVKKLSPDELSARQKGLVSVAHDGTAPTVKVTPDMRPLFKPLDQKLASKLDAGTLNEHFSSQQLVPLSADLNYPYSAVGKIFFSTAAGDKTCSAFVLGNRTVITAAHCMHSGVSGSAWYGAPVFVPSYRDGAAPFLKWTANYRVLYGNWVSSGGKVPSLYDYGVFNVADQTINGVVRTVGSVVGRLGYKTDSTIPNHAHILGYPGNLDGGQKMHQVTSQSALAVDPGNVEYGSDMSVGAGGGPVIQNFGSASVGSVNGKNPGRNMVVGITSYGYNDTVKFGNGSVLVNPTFEYLYKVACNASPGNC